jgi:hypothetical protein
MITFYRNKRLFRISLVAFLIANRAFGSDFVPPAPDAIVNFANNPGFHYNTGDIYQKMSWSKFVDFLRNGKVISITTPRDDKRLAGPITFRGPLTATELVNVKADMNGGAGNAYLQCRGVAATNKTIYYWQLMNDNVLRISDEQGDGCFLRIQ